MNGLRNSIERCAGASSGRGVFARASKRQALDHAGARPRVCGIAQLPAKLASVRIWKDSDLMVWMTAPMSSRYCSGTEERVRPFST